MCKEYYPAYGCLTVSARDRRVAVAQSLYAPFGSQGAYASAGIGSPGWAHAQASLADWSVSAGYWGTGVSVCGNAVLIRSCEYYPLP